MFDQAMTQSHPKGMSAGLIFLFALAGGAAVGNLYWAQPLLANIAEAYGISTGSAGILVTVTQIGYALGVFLIVPLGDVVDRRRMIPAMMLCSVVALVTSASAPNFALLVASLFAVGVTTVTGQLLTPLASDLVEPERRGRVVGTIVSGLLTGILLSRTISGVVGDLFGWRAIYWLAAAVSTLMAVLLAMSIPADAERAKIRYRALLSSAIGVVRRHRVVRVTLVLGATAFSVFTMFWTGLTFLLSAQPFAYSLTQIGLVGLVGLAGALGAQRTGILHDKGWSVPVSGLALLIALLSVIIAGVGATSIIAILIAVLVLDIAIQAVNVLNQTRLLSVDPSARSRLNTAFVTNNFIGGAIGAALASLLWEIGGWTAIMLGAGLQLAFALFIWIRYREALDISDSGAKASAISSANCNQS